MNAALSNKLWHVQTPQVTVTLLLLRKNKGMSLHVIIPISIANLLAFSKLRKISSGGSVMLLSMLWEPVSAPPHSAILLRLFCKLLRNVKDASKLRVEKFYSKSLIPTQNRIEWNRIVFLNDIFDFQSETTGVLLNALKN